MQSNNRAFQSNRVFWIAEKTESKTGWYFEAREGVFGPFHSQLKAESDLALLIEGNPMRRSDTDWVQDSWSNWEPLHAAAG
jgi:hypothetical protein